MVETSPGGTRPYSSHMRAWTAIRLAVPLARLAVPLAHAADTLIQMELKEISAAWRGR